MRRIIPLVLVILGAQLLLAHHGGGTFDLSKSIELKGKLTRIDLINPHSWLYSRTPTRMASSCVTGVR